MTGPLLADPLELMRLHLEAGFTHDAAGRMVRVNEADGGPAPRFFLGRTRSGNVSRFRHDLDEDLVRALDAVASAEPIGDLDAGARCHDEVVRLLARRAAVEQVWSGPAFAFREVPGAPPLVVSVTDENAEVLRPHFADWLLDIEVCQPFLAYVIDRAAVSLCASARVSAAHEAGVETCPECRGRGYALEVVSAWARAVRERDCVPLYSTSWENGPSRSVAAKLGLVHYGTTLHFT